MTPLLMLLVTTDSLITAAIEFTTNLQPNLIIKPYEEFCRSGSCTYTVPLEFHKHLKSKNHEAAWYAPVEGCLADPFNPNKVHSVVINVTPESLITKHHIDGVWIDIRNHDTNEHLKIIFRAMNKTHASLQAFANVNSTTTSLQDSAAKNSTSANSESSGLTRSQTIIPAVVGSILAFLVVLVVVLCYRKSICRWIRSQKEHRDVDVNLRNVAVVAEVQQEEAQALNTKMDQI